MSGPADALGWQIFGAQGAPKRAPVARDMAGVKVVEQSIDRCSGRRLGTHEGPSVFTVVYIVEGLEWGYATGGRCLVKAGDVLTWHTSHSLGFEVIEPIEKVSFAFDAKALGALLPTAPTLCDMHVPKASVLGPLVSGFFQGLASELDAMPSAYHAGAMSMALEVVSNGLRLDREARAKGPAEVLLARIERHVELHIDDADLTAERIAEAHGISRRYLDALFEQKGIAPEDFVQERRLVRSHDLLLVAPFASSTAELAARCGFEDMRAFELAFRKRFGFTPDALRRAGSAE